MQKEMDGSGWSSRSCVTSSEEGPLMTATLGARSRRGSSASVVTPRMIDDFRRSSRRRSSAAPARAPGAVGVIERVGKERGYYMIVESGALGPLCLDRRDLTDEIIRAYDRRLRRRRRPDEHARGSRS